MTSPVTQLLDRAQARWAALGTAAPDLAPAITLQRALVNRTIDTVDRLRRLDRPVLNLEPGLAATKLRPSTPELRGGSAGEVAQRGRNCLDAGRIDVPSLLIASFDRNQSAIRIKAMHEGIAPDVLWLAAELAVGPAAHVAQRVVFTPESRQ